MSTVDLGSTVGASPSGAAGGDLGGNYPNPSVVAFTGNLPVSNLAGGAGANATTFWRGDGSWVVPAGASGSASGTVTQLDTGAGLFGGPITTTGTISIASVSLVNQVVGSLPLSQTTGSISLVLRVSGNLPLSQTSGSLSLTGQVVNNLPLSQTSGSISLTAQVSGTLPAAQVGIIDITSGTSGSVSLVNKVVGNLPVTNLNTGSGASSASFWRGDGIWATPSGSGTVTQVDTGAGLFGGPITTTGTISIASISLTNQVVNNLPLSQTSGSISLTAQVSGNLPLTQTTGSISLALRVAGNLPVTNLDTGSAASSATFWRGDGIWAVPAGSSGSAAGTVTQVNTGAGLFGGPITTTGTISIASVSLTNQVVNNLPLSQTSGSISLTAQVSGILPAAQVGVIDVTSGTSGSVSLTNKVSGNLPLSQTSGSISLVNQVAGNLPVTNLNTGSGASSATFWRGDGIWAAAGGSSSITRTEQAGNYTLVSGDKGNLQVYTGAFVVGSSANTFTITAAATLGSGWYGYIQNLGSTSSNLILTTGGGNIDGLASYSIYPGDARLVVCDGSNFYTELLGTGYAEYTTVGANTFNVPARVTTVQVNIWGAGGGGGSGRRGATATIKAGAGGGGGGAFVTQTFKAINLGTSVTVTIGSGGNFGAAQTADSTNGNVGAVGGNTTFGTFFTAFGGGAGSLGGQVTNSGGGGGGWLTAGGNGAGAASALGGGPSPSAAAAGNFGGGSGTVGAAGFAAAYGGGAGGGGNIFAVSVAGGNSLMGGAGGGAGGCIGSNSTATPRAGGDGGSNFGAISGGGGPGGAAGTSGVDGGVGSSSFIGPTSLGPGLGGGGGGSGFDANGSGSSSAGGAGGTGGIACGGGGGGASLNGFNSGAGGGGGNGYARIWYW